MHILNLSSIRQRNLHQLPARRIIIRRDIRPLSPRREVPIFIIGIGNIIHRPRIRTIPTRQAIVGVIRIRPRALIRRVTRDAVSVIIIGVGLNRRRAVGDGQQLAEVVVGVDVTER